VKAAEIEGRDAGDDNGGVLMANGKTRRVNRAPQLQIVQITHKRIRCFKEGKKSKPATAVTNVLSYKCK
jgi:hypothetical protein